MISPSPHPRMSEVTIADAVGLIYVADLADILDAQMLINSGRAAAAALAQELHVQRCWHCLCKRSEKTPIPLLSALLR